MVYIIIPAYNAQKYISNAVKSVIKQTYQDWNLIIVDDGSTDKTPEICDRLSASDQRIHVIHQKNLGTFAARFTGIEYCLKMQAGDSFITFLDSDDAFAKASSLEIMVNTAQKENADIVCTQFIRTFDNKCLIKRGVIFSRKKITYSVFRDEEIINKLYISFFGVSFIGYEMCSKLYRLKLFDNFTCQSTPPMRYGEDLVSNIIIFPKAKCVVQAPDRLYAYSSKGATNTFIKTFLDDYVLIYDIRKDILKNVHIPQDADFYNKAQLKNVLWTWLIMCYTRGKFSEEEMISEIKRCCDISQINEILSDERIFNSSKQPSGFTSSIINRDYIKILQLVKKHSKQTWLVFRIINKIKNIFTR